MRPQAWVKSIAAGSVIMFGGPLLMNKITPTEEELRKRYNPDLQRRSLEGREQKLAEANEFISQLKDMSKDSRPIWTVWKERELAEKKAARKAEREKKMEKRDIAEEIKRQRLHGDGSGSGAA